jgi:hypothetical protein
LIGIFYVLSMIIESWMLKIKMDRYSFIQCLQIVFCDKIHRDHKLMAKIETDKIIIGCQRCPYTWTVKTDRTNNEKNI